MCEIRSHLVGSAAGLYHNECRLLVMSVESDSTECTVAYRRYAKFDTAAGKLVVYDRQNPVACIPSTVAWQAPDFVSSETVLESP